MFETAELGHRVSKQELKRREGPLREALLEAQNRLKSAGFPVIMVIGGVDAAGKGETVNVLVEWLDPRGVEVHALGEATDEERERPSFWRFWRQLPPRGRLGVFLGSWYTQPILGRVRQGMKGRRLDEALRDILAFERLLADDGALILKFWLHLSRKEQKKKLESLQANPLHRWRVTRKDWENLELYDEFAAVSESVLRQTSTGHAPWHILEAADPEYRHLRVLETLRDRLAARLEAPANRPPPGVEVRPLPVEDRGILSTLDYGRTVTDRRYKSRLCDLQARLHDLAHRTYRKNRSMVVVFEGSDAAGKGGTIRRATAAMDVRNYRIVPVAAPTDEERARPYMWRFWRQIPRSGRITIFDRSWYGRVLVEPIEGFCTPAECERAYKEINDFEDQLFRNDIHVVKFWLAITPDEQLRRFEDRERVAFKRYKITPDDWRNRDKWDLYEAMVHHMVERTSTTRAPWFLVPANDKKQARLEVLERLCERIESAL